MDNSILALANPICPPASISVAVEGYKIFRIFSFEEGASEDIDRVVVVLVPVGRRDSKLSVPSMLLGVRPLRPFIRFTPSMNGGSRERVERAAVVVTSGTEHCESFVCCFIASPERYSLDCFEALCELV